MNKIVFVQCSRKIKTLNNEEKSAANFYSQVASQVSDMFCKFYLLNNHKIANNSTTTEAGEKISTGIFRILEGF